MISDKKYIAYYRVSTVRQEQSGLGLEAQKKDVQNFVACADCIIAEYTEVESGRKSNRTELNKALAQCKATGATLIIAMLDRLSRDVEFIFALRNAGVDFIACDMGDFNTLTLGIFAVVAQYESEMISERVKKALAVKKEQGVKLGSPIAAQTAKAIHAKGREQHSANARANENNIKATALIMALRANGLNLSEIARELNAKGFKTSRGKEFQAVQVKILIERANKTQSDS